MEGPEKFRFVYTCVMRGGKVYFILDPTPAGDADGDGVDDKSHLMQPYPEASLELISSLRSGEVTVMSEPQRDPWGVFLSAYAPIKNAAGEDSSPQPGWTWSFPSMKNRCARSGRRPWRRC